MSILEWFKPQKKSAQLAKERLQIIISHERGKEDAPDYLPMLQKDIVEVIAKYVEIDEEQVIVQLDKRDNYSVLELNVALPQPETA